jgi:hypothetical protein
MKNATIAKVALAEQLATRRKPIGVAVCGKAIWGKTFKVNPIP